MLDDPGRGPATQILVKSPGAASWSRFHRERIRVLRTGGICDENRSRGGRH